MAQRLRAAFEHLRESIVLTDADDRFVFANRAFRDLNHNVAQAIAPGQKFEDYLRAGLAAGNYADAIGREQEWLEARLAERRNPGDPVERPRSDGRWFRIYDRRLPDGSMIRFSTDITDRKRAEAVLHERHRDLELIINSVPEMITRLDREERFQFANRAYADLMELPVEDIVGRRVADVLSAEAYAQIKPALDRAMSGDPVSTERAQRLSNGELVEVEERYTPDVDVRGRVIGMIAVHRDITAERKARRSIAESEARFRALTYLSSDFFWETDADLRYASFVAGPRYKAAQPLEYKIGKHPWEIPSMHPGAEEWHRHRERMQAREAFRDFLVIRFADDASGRAFQFSGDPRHDAGGNFIGYHGIGRDVTDAWRAERALAKSETRFRGLTELSSDWYWEQDEQFRQTFLSDGYDGLSGAQRTSTLGTKRWERTDVTPLSCSWAEHRAALEARLPFRDFEYLRDAGDGSRVYVSLSGEPVFDDTGGFTGYRGVGRNITARKRDEQLLRIEHQVTRALSEAEDAATGVRAVLRVVCEVLNMGCGRHFEVDEAAGVLRFQDGWCLPEPAYQRHLDHSRLLVFRPGEGLAGIVWQTGEPIWSQDTSRDPRVPDKSLIKDSEIRGVFTFGVLSEGRTIGVLSVSGRTAREPDQRLLQAARVIGSQVGQFLQRNKAELALRASEERFRGTFDLAASGIAHVDLDGRFTRVNRSMCRLLGRSAAELVGREVRDFSHSDDRDVTAAARKRMRAGEIESEHFEKRYLRKDGTTVWVDLTVALVRDGGGVPEYEIAIFDDITERMVADAALRAQTERLQIGQAAARMIIMDRDIPNDWITWSDSPEWLRGPLPASGRYPLFRDQVHPEDRARFLAARDAALDSLQGGSQEFRLVRTDGEVLWILSRQKVFADANGKAVRMLAALLDITDRKRAEQALADSEARFRAIFERSSVGMAITGIDGTYLSVNAAFARFFGYAIEDLVGRHKMSDLRLEGDTEGEALYRRLIAGEIDVFERDRPYRRRDGAPIWGRATVTAVRDAAGKPLYVVAVISDVTDEIFARGRIERMNAELEERVETRTAELREAMKELDAFTYSVSHDLRAPIGAVSGFAHLLRSAEAAHMTEDGLRLLDFIDHNAERMTRLIEGLLRFSRLGRGELRRTRVLMNQLAGESLLDYVDEAARAQISAGSMPDCEGDPALLGQVWSNLVGNALKYSRGANPPRVEIGWDAGRTAYYVRDNGVGFDMAYAGKLFGVFERLHHESEFEGSGIGLAIAERIVKRHGGAIWAEAAPERGATFWFTVPESGRGAAPEIRPSPEKPR